MGKEIKIIISELDSSIKKMDSQINDLESIKEAIGRSTFLSKSCSKGKSADKMQQVTQEMMDTTDKFIDLITKTRGALLQAKKGYKEKDERIADEVRR